MTSNLTEFLELSPLYAFILCVFFDVILGGTWNKAYFSTGLLLFVKRIHVETHHNHIPPMLLYERRFFSSWSSSLIFKELTLNTYGFREKALEWRLIIHYPRLLHGMLIFDWDKNEVIVKGFANWTSLWFLIICIVNAVSNPNPVASLWLLFVISLIGGTLYLVQYNLFSDVAEYAATLWSRK